VVTRDGFPLGYEVFAGNRHDSTTVQEIVARMEARYGAADRIWALSRRAGLGTSIPTVLEELARIQNTDVVLPATDGRELRIRCVVRSDPAQAILLDRPGTPPAPKNPHRNPSKVVTKTLTRVLKNNDLRQIFPFSAEVGLTRSVRA
jgi:hypothetical protein